MNPAIIELILQVLIKYGPDAYNRIVDAIHKPTPTADDWKIAFAIPSVDKLASTKLPGEA